MEKLLKISRQGGEEKEKKVLIWPQIRVTDKVIDSDVRRDHIGKGKGKGTKLCLSQERLSGITTSDLRSWNLRLILISEHLLKEGALT